jgi:hypothetical protein
MINWTDPIALPKTAKMVGLNSACNIKAHAGSLSEQSQTASEPSAGTGHKTPLGEETASTAKPRGARGGGAVRGRWIWNRWSWRPLDQLRRCQGKR